MLRIIQSNDPELLALALLRRADARKPAPGQPEQFVVPTLGYARWLTRRFARHRGICANVRFDFLAQYLWRLFAAVVPDIQRHSPFDSEVMTLRCFQQLGALPDDEDHAVLRRWIGAQGKQSARGRLELAARCTRLLQTYLAYRPDWLEAWAQGRLLGLAPAATERWQQRLWRELLRAEPVAGPEHPKEAVFKTLDAWRAAHPGQIHPALPQEIRIIGTPALPPLYLGVLERLARHTDVTIWFLNPCREYWADLRPEALRLNLQQQTELQLPEVGHPLLASWGRQVREQFARFAAIEQVEGVSAIEQFLEPQDETLLPALKRSLLDLTPLQAPALRSTDPSLQIHSAHSLLRQCEILHDALLHRFSQQPELLAEDVLVLTPDLDTAAPIIDAVFGTAPSQRRLPYSISGQSGPQSTPLRQAFDALLDLLASRFTAPDVFDVLRLRPIAAALDLDTDALDRLQNWCGEAGVRWGLDARQRASLGLPAEDDHTWAQGLHRLLLGYAAGPSLGEPLDGLAVMDDLEGSQAQILGRGVQALSLWAQAAEDARQPRTLDAWCHWLLALFDRCLLSERDHEAEGQRLRAALLSIAEDAGQAGCDEALPLEAARLLLKQRLEREAPGAVPGGRITFTAMQPLRGVHFRVIALLGMDDGAFPRTPQVLEFDLTAHHPRAGDRRRGDEDRGALLDAVLCAQDLLWIGYTGRSQRDNAPLPPAVPVAELIDFVLGAVPEGDERDAARRALVTEHPLQAFAPDYFRDRSSIPRSHSEDLCATASALDVPMAKRNSARALFDTPLPAPPEEARTVGLTQLIEFLRHPTRYLLRRQLRIGIAEAEPELEAAEPFTLDRNAESALAAALFAELRAGHDARSARQRVAAQPGLPHGPAREAALEGPLHQALDGLRRYQQLNAGASLPPLSFREAIGAYTLEGSLDGLHELGMLRFDLQDYGWSTWVEFWPRHLLLSCLRPAGVAAGSQLRAGGTALDLEALPADLARQQLEGLLDLYWQGLSTPSALIPRSACIAAKPGDDKAMSKAEACWRGNDFQGGEGADIWYRQMYGGQQTELPAGFAEAARQVFAPYYAALEASKA
jgi:exodeoxyribonuclease V gamma subunit